MFLAFSVGRPCEIEFVSKSTFLNVYCEKRAEFRDFFHNLLKTRAKTQVGTGKAEPRPSRRFGRSFFL